MVAQPKYLTGFKQTHAELWGKQPCQVQHELSSSGLFTEEALAALIERAPVDLIDIVYMGEQGRAKRFWRKGELGDTTGAEAIEAVRQGRMWINLVSVGEYAEEYRELVDDVFTEQENLIPGFKTFRRRAGILISSPKAQVYYHCDVPGQSLWQVSGVKRVYLYPNTEPFLKPRDVERVVLGETEEEIEYQEWFEEYAQVIDLEPGEMLHWPLNGPHRVENHDMLNVSMTTEHFTDEVRRTYAMNFANGVLRNKFGITPSSRNISGVGFWGKAALAFAWRAAGLHKKSKCPRIIDFRINRDSHSIIEDIQPYQLG